MRSVLSVLVAALGAASSVMAAPVADGANADASGVSCRPFKAFGWKTSKGKMYFYDNNPTDVNYAGAGFHAPTLPANTTIAPNGFLILANHNTSTGYPFNIQTCDVSTPTVSITSNTTDSSCTHGSCYIAYTNYIRIVNPATSHCLTAVHPSANSTYHFAPCDANPATYAQFWVVTQYVTYRPSIQPGASVTFEQVDLGNVQPGDAFDTDQFLALMLSRGDNRTVEVGEYGYTQAGLSATLVEA